MAETPKNAPDSDEPPKKRGPGPPVGSQNALRHGLRAGKLPRELAYIEKRTNIFRRDLEALVVKLKGDISVNDAAAINSATKWERHACLAADWLRKEASKLSASDRLKFSEAIAKASDNRDRNIRLLQLDAKPEPKRLADVIIEMRKDN